jgi:AraC-like DNA-binding protein
VNFPALRDRKDDIPHILKKLVNKHKVYEEQGFSTEVLQKLSHYDWPENFIQLEHITARLLTLSCSNPINLNDLNLYAPEVLEAKPAAKLENNKLNINSQLIDNMLNNKWEGFNHLHIKLQKAVKYIAENFTESISLSDVSEQAFVSPSHISYLFKLHLKKSFKQILAELRIEKAKQLIKLTPHIRITDVSLEVGFGDLSHFEKIFKRYTQLTPREFKKQQVN